MKQHEQNKWFDKSELMRFMHVMSKVAMTEHTRWNAEGRVHLKYIDVRVDQRTGDFMIKDAHGEPVTKELIETVFPELRDVWMTGTRFAIGCGPVSNCVVVEHNLATSEVTLVEKMREGKPEYYFVVPAGQMPQFSHYTLYTLPHRG